MNHIAVIAALFLLSCARDPHLQQFDLVGYGLVALVGLVTAGHFRWPLAVFLAYVAGRALWYSSESPGVATELWLATAVTELRWVAFLFAAFFCLHPMRAPAAISWVVPLCAVSTMLGRPLLGFNPSLNASFLVALLPFVGGLWLWPSVALVAAVVLFWQGGVTAPGMFAAYLVMRARSVWVTVTAMVGAAVFFALKVSLLGGLDAVVTHRQDRLAFYRMTWEFFRRFIDPWVGSGLGTFVQYGPLIGYRNHFQPEQFWLSLHSDWLQLGFEMGAVGLVLGLWLYADALYRADMPTRQALILMGICAVGYFPMRVPIMAVYGVWLVAKAEGRE